MIKEPPKQFISKKEWMEIFPESEEYLQEFIIDLKEKLKIKAKAYKEKIDKAKDWFHIMFLDVWYGEDIKKLEAKIKAQSAYLTIDIPNGTRLTENDIEQAKQANWELLITPAKKYADNHFVAHCPFHTDKTPSFLVKNNFAHCFSCNYTADSIKFLMDLEGIKFYEAVRRLK